MKMTSQMDFGRREFCVQSAEGPDKWAVLKSLSEGAESYGLNHRTLGVLKALLTFLQGRALPLCPTEATVFPSNKTLSRRLNGMPESTLRRHLAILVRSGIVSRSDSPNRKRYARKLGPAQEIAFGFDLSPLAAQSADFEDAARCASEMRQRCAILRDRILLLRQAAMEDHPELTKDVAKRLRRKLSVSDLEQIEAQLSAMVQTPETHIEKDPIPAKMSVPDGQNERHIQYSDKTNLDSENPHPENLTLSELLDRCQETRTLFPDQIQSWSDMLEVAKRLVPMLGIDQPAWVEATRKMGLISAAITVFCIHERLGDIRSPGAYLRVLGQQANLGRFSIGPMVRALKHSSAKVVS